LTGLTYRLTTNLQQIVQLMVHIIVFFILLS